MYWFYIDNYVHISIKRRQVLLYNTYNGKILEFYDEPEILNLVRKLTKPGNLQVLKIKEDELQNGVIRNFIKAIRDNFMGDILEASTDGKPIQMIPIVKVQNEFKHLQDKVSHSIGEDILKYISEVSLYINDRCPQNCNYCKKAYKQFLCCTASKSGKNELSLKDIQNFFEELTASFLTRINILGGNILVYSRFLEFVNYMNRLDVRKTYYIHYLNLASFSEKLKVMKSSTSHLKIMISFPVDLEKLEIALKAANFTGIESDISFLIQSEEDYNDANLLISDHSIVNHSFHALFNGSNLDFFKKHIYIDKKEIEEARPEMKRIYANRAVNALNFGLISVLSNKRIYANVNFPALGLLGSDSIYDVVFKEMEDGNSWMSIRQNVFPCKKCNFEKICPPISNYNYIIGKNNLCHIWKTKKDN